MILKLDVFSSSDILTNKYTFLLTNITSNLPQHILFFSYQVGYIYFVT